jgi:hypothetical protein
MTWQLDQVAAVRAITNVRKRVRRSGEVNIILASTQNLGIDLME